MDEAHGYRRVKTLFLEAGRLPRGERTRFLRAQCGEDADLEGRVRRLLSRDEEDKEFLEGPAMGRDDGVVAPGTRLGAFRIMRALGEGGMGVVYEAQQEEPSRRVALKLVRHGLFAERLRARFRHEIRVLGQLRHPGVAQLYEAGTLPHAGEQVPYFAMELVDGEPLLRAAERLEVRDRLVLLAQICDAVDHAHQKGVIHRDLKPANILVETASTAGGTDKSGTVVPFQVKILDFGVARVMDSGFEGTSAHTQAGQLIGTLAYMSPEQAAGEPDAVDVRSDVYAIGIIAFEMLSGRRPYEVEGKTLPEAARTIREQEPARMSLHDRSFRGDIETIVAKALQKDRALRYRSAADLAADIRRYLRDEPILARAPSAVYLLRKFANRHKPLVFAAAAVLLAMATATGISVRQAGAARRAQAFAEREQSRADQAAAAAEREATRAILAGVAAAISSADPITAARMLDRTAESDRGWAWRYWHARLDESVALTSVPGKIAAAWMSGDGEEIAALTADGVVCRGARRLEVLPEVTRLSETPLRFAAFTDQGRRIITDGPDRRTLTLFDAADGRVIQRHERLEAAIGLIKASDDGSRVLVGPRRPGRAPGDVLWLLSGSDPDAAWTGVKATISAGTACAAISRNGRWLALGRGIEAVMLWDATTPNPRDLALIPRGAQAVAVSEEGSRVATGGVDKTVCLWDGATGQLVHSLAGHSGTVTALAFDPQAMTLASAGVDHTIRLWDVADGKAIATFIGQTGPVEREMFIGQTGPVDHLRFSEDGALLMSASRDGSIRLWQRQPFEGACILRGHTGYVYAVGFTPDGSRVLSGSWDGTLRAWNAADGSPAGVAASTDGYVTALGRSPDGKVIATGHKSASARSSSTIHLWDSATLRHLDTFEPTQGEISDLIFSADGSRLFASRQSFGVEEYDLGARPPPRRELLVNSRPDSIALSPDGRELASGHLDGSITLTPLASARSPRRLVGHTDRVRGIAYHPTSPLLASASDDGTARLWDLATGRGIELRGHADKVYCVEFSPDGRLLATGSEDTTIVIWEVLDSPADPRAEELTRLRGHDAYVYSLAFSPDGARLVSGSGDTTVRIWDTRPVRERWRTGTNGQRHESPRP